MRQRGQVGPRIALATAVGLLSLAGGCWGNERTPFPPGLEPLEEVTVDPPAPVDGDRYPEVLNIESGATARYDWVQARGYVKAPLVDVYAAMRTPEVVVDHREVARWSVEHDVEPEYDHSFRVHNEVDDVITVEFDVTWRFGLVEGNEEEPTVVAGTWQKTYGTTFISLLRGSIVARHVEAGVTELEVVEHVDAASGGADPIISYVRDLHANIVEVSHGRPLPEY